MPEKKAAAADKPVTRKSDIFILIAAGILCISMIVSSIIARSSSDKLPALPAPEVSEGQRGELGIDKNINEETIDQYLGRSDSVYYDMRMLEDPANYEAIGGDRFLSGYVDGFEVIPYPYLVSVSGLPEAVGQGYTGPSLFTKNEDGTYTANYRQSDQILADLFPKDKNIFLMCGGGGYAGMTKDLLVKKGWDASKIYVVGGYWFYDGEHDTEVKLDDGTYAFWKVPYHNIDFSTLTSPAVTLDQEYYNHADIIDINKTEYENLIKDKKSFVIMVDNAGCTTTAKMREMIASLPQQFTYYRIYWPEAKDTNLKDYVKYFPSLVVVEKGDIKYYLRADRDEDAAYYNDAAALESWLNQKVSFENGK